MPPSGEWALRGAASASIALTKVGRACIHSVPGYSPASRVTTFRTAFKPDTMHHPIFSADGFMQGRLRINNPTTPTKAAFTAKPLSRHVHPQRRKRGSKGLTTSVRVTHGAFHTGHQLLNRKDGWTDGRVIRGLVRSVIDTITLTAWWPRGGRRIIIYNK